MAIDELTSSDESYIEPEKCCRMKVEFTNKIN